MEKIIKVFKFIVLVINVISEIIDEFEKDKEAGKTEPVPAGNIK